MTSPFDDIEDLRRRVEMLSAIPDEIRRKLLGLSPPPFASMTEAVRRYLETVRAQTAIPDEARRYILGFSSPSATMMEEAKRARETVSSLAAIPEEIRRNFLGFFTSNVRHHGRGKTQHRTGVQRASSSS
jgi:hypothetical protein